MNYLICEILKQNQKQGLCNKFEIIKQLYIQKWRNLFKRSDQNLSKDLAICHLVELKILFVELLVQLHSFLEIIYSVAISGVQNKNKTVIHNDSQLLIKQGIPINGKFVELSNDQKHIYQMKRKRMLPSKRPIQLVVAQKSQYFWPDRV